MSCVQSFGHQHLRCCAASLSMCSRFIAPALHFKPLPDASVSCRHVLCFVRCKTRIIHLTRFFSLAANFDAKMATPETFSETESETMYEKVSSSVISKPDVVISLTAGALGCMEFARGGPVCARGRIRGRKARRARSDSLHCCAARWANLHIIFDAPVARPDVGQKPSLTARAKRRTTPTPKRRRRPN